MVFFLPECLLFVKIMGNLASGVGVLFEHFLIILLDFFTTKLEIINHYQVF